MGYSKQVTPRTEALYGKYFDLIVDIPPGRDITFSFTSLTFCASVRVAIYNWIAVNKYQGYYSIKWGDEEKLSLTITNNTPRSNRFPSPAEIQHYLYSLPNEIWFEATLKFLSTFNLYPEEELNKLQWEEPEGEIEVSKVTPKPSNVFDEIVNIKEEEDD